MAKPTKPKQHQTKASIKKARGWKTVIDFTKIRKGGIPIDELIAKLELLVQRDRAMTKQGHCDVVAGVGIEPTT